jgi:hypothetical protein
LRLVGDERKNYATFTVVRHPVSRFWSALWYLRNQLPNHQFYYSDAAERAAICGYDTGYEFLKCCGQSLHMLLHFAPQHLWLDQGEPDYILKFENLDSDFADMCDQEGWGQMEIPHLNKTEGDMDSPEAFPETNELVQLWYNEDYRRFDYE